MKGIEFDTTVSHYGVFNPTYFFVGSPGSVDFYHGWIQPSGTLEISGGVIRFRSDSNFANLILTSGSMSAVGNEVYVNITNSFYWGGDYATSLGNGADTFSKISHISN